MATSSTLDLRLKQRAVIEFLTLEKATPIDIHRRMKIVYGETCVEVSTVRRRSKELAGTSPTETDLHDKARCGRPNTVNDIQHQERVDEIVQANRRIKCLHLRFWDQNLRRQGVLPRYPSLRSEVTQSCDR
ncbi:transposase [Elysia marginata]|uniref:Transposase n=1 Tax=Elysia marginata TaxID=1093978 RepID=A0AAV4F9W3_9GAST|nr:transposase [Elysia marginata]